MNELEKMIGAQVLDVRKVHDYWQLAFEGGWNLTINNSFRFNDGKKQVEELKSLELVGWQESFRQLQLKFSKSNELVIDLSNCGFQGSPEAVILSTPTADTIVWRGREMACPCCGYATLNKRSNDEICELCWWHDDGQDNQDADKVRGGSNYELSLTQARVNFIDHGISCPSRLDRKEKASDMEKFRRLRLFKKLSGGSVQEIRADD